MKETPLLFTGDMVRAILEDRKTQTRRIMKHQPSEFLDIEEGDNGVWTVSGDNPTNYDGEVQMNDWEYTIKCPYGAPGDRLIVKEATWMWCLKQRDGLTKKGNPKYRYIPARTVKPIYCAEHSAKPKTRPGIHGNNPEYVWKYKSGRYMPRWASRITLEITEVRVDRLNDISEEDAIAEGITVSNEAKQAGHEGMRAKSKFKIIWDSCYGKGAWDKNPFVWAIAFKRIKDGLHHI